MRAMLLIMIVIIAGCATPEQIAARRAAEAEAQRQRNIAYTQQLAAQCDAIGYQRNTDPWRNCLLQLHQQNQAQNAAMRQMLLQQYIQQQQRPTQTRCNRDFLGNVNCTTY